MWKSLNKIAQELKDNNKKVQLVRVFNGTGKTRRSKKFKDLVSPKSAIKEKEIGLSFT